MNSRHVAPLVVVLALLPFVGKALHVDDPLFVWAAKRIVEHPLDPYGASVNWYGTAEPLHEIAQNPPLVAYFLALVGALCGWSERALHLACLIPAAFAAAGIFRLARRFTTEPLLAALAAIATPAFLVSATTLMCDVPMLALYVWALALWMEGTDERSRGKLATAAALCALAALAKYFGFSAALLMAVWSLLRKRREDLVWLLVPALALLAYELATRAQYGHGLLSSAAGYGGEIREKIGPGPLAQIVVALAFAGGAIPLVVPRRDLLAAGTIAVVLTAILLVTHPQHFPWLHLDHSIHVRVVVQLALYAAIGLSTLFLALEDLRARRDASSVLLAVWIAGVFVFAAVLNWTINARSLLPLAPAVAILLARRTEGARRRWLALLPSAILALAVACADLSLANADREAARSVHARCGGGPGSLVFQGHWGFQYHLEQLGGRPMDFADFQLQPGDVVVVPLNATNPRSLPAGACRLEETLTFPTLPWLATLQPDAGAGFYASTIGCLPYSFGPAPPERFDVIRITRAIASPR